jgi:hypothetical protein
MFYYRKDLTMAQIRDFNNKRNQYLLNAGSNNPKIDESEKKSWDTRIARYRQLKFYSFLAVVVVAALIAVAVYIHWKQMTYTSYTVIQQTQWSKSSDSQSLDLDGTIFNYSNDGMNCTDTKGKVIWNQTYEMQTPIVSTCNKTVAVGDYNGRNIYVANTQGMLGTIETTIPIRDFCVSSNGIVAAVLDDSSVTAIYLFDTSGQELVYFKTRMSKSGYPIAIDISDDGTQVAVSYIKAESGKISSSIGFYNFSSVGQNYTDNLVSAYGYSEAVVPLVRFMGDNTVFAVADNRLMFYQGKQKPENTADILINEDIVSVFYDDSHVGLVFYNSGSDQTYRLEVYDTSAKKVSEIEFDLDYKDILFEQTGIFIYNDSECIIYNWSNKLKYEGRFEDYVECLIPGSGISRHTIVTEDAIKTIELQ